MGQAMHSLEVLEFESVREMLAGHCETQLGAQRSERLQPSFGPEEVWASLDLTKAAHALLGEEAPPSMGAVKDLRSALKRAEKGSVLGGQEIYEIAAALSAMRAMRRFMEVRKQDYSELWVFAEALPNEPKVEEAVFAALEQNGDIRDSASPELARLRHKIRATQGRVIERIQSYVSGKAREWLSDPLYTVRDGRYVIPLKAEYKGKVKGIVHDTSSSGQTVFLEPEDVLQLGNQLREAESAERDECDRVLAELSEKVGSVSGAATAGIEQASELDFLFACARLGYAMRGCVPAKSWGFGIALTAARHPLLDDKSVVPVSITIGFDHKGLLITGPNTGGKTVAIKTLGLCVLMAQSGLLPPADEIKLGPFSAVWADIGDEQSLQQSLSTFSGHIRNIAAAIKGLREGVLVLLDEIGAGTDPGEGAALAKAILSEIAEKGGVVLASTHYGELKAFAYNTPGFQNAAMEFDVKTLRPTYRLIMGAPGASHALKIAERYGIPSRLIETALGNLGEEQQDVALMMEKLELAQRQSRIAQSEADKRLHELKRAQDVADRKLKEADEIRRTVHSQANAQVEDALREIRLQAEEIFEELKKAKVDERVLQKAREDLKSLQQIGRETAAQFEVEPESEPDEQPLARGMRIKVEGYAQPGVLLDEPSKANVAVQMGPLRVTVPLSKVTPALQESKAPRKATANLTLRAAFQTSRELHLRQRRAEDALEELERYLDEAVLAGLDSVRIVHGKGEGVLRGLVRQRLKAHAHVASFREGEPGEGGEGVTIAVLR